ncbi:MAG: hypothetical protein MHMPM18_001593 [Marteilia pararefringens]
MSLVGHRARKSFTIRLYEEERDINRLESIKISQEIERVARNAFVRFLGKIGTVESQVKFDVIENGVAKISCDESYNIQIQNALSLFMRDTETNKNYLFYFYS